MNEDQTGGNDGTPDSRQGVNQPATAPTDLNKFRKSRRKEKAKGTTLCKRGFHKWVFDDKKQFDVKSGKLVSIQRCKRCGQTRNYIS